MITLRFSRGHGPFASLIAWKSSGDWSHVDAVGKARGTFIQLHAPDDNGRNVAWVLMGGKRHRKIDRSAGGFRRTPQT